MVTPEDSRDRTFRLGITPDKLAAQYPLLYHMAAVGSWPSIQRHGLLSTTALLDLFGTVGAERERVEAQRRIDLVRIEHPEYGTALIRDQKPMDDVGLLRCLNDGVTSSRLAA